MTRSNAIRAALVEAAARLDDERLLATEVAALEADDDRAEMLAVAELMEAGLTFSPSGFQKGSATNSLRRRAPIRRSTPRSVVIVAPTSISARPASFRPEIRIDRKSTRLNSSH